MVVKTHLGVVGYMLHVSMTSVMFNSLYFCNTITVRTVQCDECSVLLYS